MFKQNPNKIQKSPNLKILNIAKCCVKLYGKVVCGMWRYRAKQNH